MIFQCKDKTQVCVTSSLSHVRAEMKNVKFTSVDWDAYHKKKREELNNKKKFKKNPEMRKEIDDLNSMDSEGIHYERKEIPIEKLLTKKRIECESYHILSFLPF